jgi:hypothetical protein
MSDDVEDTAPWEPDEGRFSITLKGHKDYSATWVNISDRTAGGLKRRIVAFFGWSEEESAELSLAQVVFNATQEFHAMHNIGDTFGTSTRAINGRRGSARDRAYAEASGEQAAPDPKEVLLAQIEAQESVPSLKRLYGENQAAFEEKDGDNLTPAATELLAAYKAKGKLLTATANQ